MNPTQKAQAYQYSHDFFAVKKGSASDFADEFDPKLIDKDNVYWLNFHDLEDRASIERICQKIGLDKLSCESIFLPLRRAKVEEYPNYLFFQLHTLQNTNLDANQTDQVTFVLGSQFLLSFQTNEGLHFGEVRERIEKSKGKITIVLDGDAWEDAKRLYFKLSGGKLYGKIKVVKLPVESDIADMRGVIPEDSYIELER